MTELDLKAWRCPPEASGASKGKQSRTPRLGYTAAAPGWARSRGMYGPGFLRAPPQGGTVTLEQTPVSSDG